jgi:hypothetical protein
MKSAPTWLKHAKQIGKAMSARVDGCAPTEASSSDGSDGKAAAELARLYFRLRGVDAAESVRQVRG